MAERLVLRTGSARWLRNAHAAASLAALLTLLTAGAELAWTAAAAAALLLANRMAARRMADPRLRGRLHLAADGEAVLFAKGRVRALRLQAGGWHCRCLCVLPLTDPESGRSQHFILCRSLNRPDAWRRLLVRLRLPLQAQPNPARNAV
jgi:hypothetical protein